MGYSNYWYFMWFLYPPSIMIILLTLSLEALSWHGVALESYDTEWPSHELLTQSNRLRDSHGWFRVKARFQSKSGKDLELPDFVQQQTMRENLEELIEANWSASKLLQKQVWDDSGAWAYENPRFRYHHFDAAFFQLVNFLTAIQFVID